jgi:hypothetical protein
MAANTKTVTVNAVGTASPSRLASATVRGPVRAMVRNNGPGGVFISYSANALISSQSVLDSYFLPADRSDVFVLEPNDVLYCAGVGAGGSVSVAASKAFPLQFAES